jgi:hypothetical protein
MRTPPLAVLVNLVAAFGAFVLPFAAPAAGKVYRWVDENGKVHYGDAIPPEYSNKQHDIVGDQGQVTKVHSEQPAAPVRSDRDRALLGTYASVEEIEQVRDRRTGYLDSQNQVARDRLEALRTRRGELQMESGDGNELATVEQHIVEYEAEIAKREAEMARIGAEFDADIARFRELKGLAASGG